MTKAKAKSRATNMPATTTAKPPTTRDRSNEISPTLRVALDSMVLEGLELDEAARKAKMTTRGVRLALSRPAVLRYLKRVRADLISAIRATNPRRLRQLRDQDANPAAAVRAAVAIEHLDMVDGTGPGQGHVPGMQIVIIGASVEASPAPRPVPHVIEHDPCE